MTNVIVPDSSHQIGKVRKPRRKPSTHQHHIPNYDRKIKSIPFIKHAVKRAQNTDYQQVKGILHLRRNGGAIVTKTLKDGEKVFKQIPPRRDTIHSSRLKMFQEMVPAILNNVDYSANRRFMMELQLSVEQLARHLGVLHEYEAGYDYEDEDNPGQYRAGRKSCDPLRGALQDFEACKYIICVRGYDEAAGQRKIMRLFLTPLFFEDLLGMSPRYVKKLIELQQAYIVRQKKQGKYKANSFVRRNVDKLAPIDSDKLASLFDYHKRWYMGDLLPEVLAAKNQKPEDLPKRRGIAVNVSTSIPIPGDKVDTKELDALKYQWRTMSLDVPYFEKQSIEDKADAMGPKESLEWFEAAIHFLKN